MSPLTVFLARLLGLYCMLIAGAMMLRRRETVATVAAMLDQPGLLMIAGVVALLLGLAIDLGHNVRTGDFLTVAVTVVGWVVTLKALMLLALPSAQLRRIYAALQYDRWFYGYMAGTFALGAILVLSVCRA
jgi:hypothetical protein